MAAYNGYTFIINWKSLKIVYLFDHIFPRTPLNLIRRATKVRLCQVRLSQLFSLGICLRLRRFYRLGHKPKQIQTILSQQKTQQQLVEKRKQ